MRPRSTPNADFQLARRGRDAVTFTFDDEGEADSVTIAYASVRTPPGGTLSGTDRLRDGADLPYVEVDSMQRCACWRSTQVKIPSRMRPIALQR